MNGKYGRDVKKTVVDQAIAVHEEGCLLLKLKVSLSYP